MNFMGRKSDVKQEDVANIPPELSDLHCFTETGGVITTSTSPSTYLALYNPHIHSHVNTQRC